jgi:phosphatidylserine decarboxylase
MSHRTRIMQTNRLGHWLPSDPEALNIWFKKTIEHAEKKKAPFHAVIQEFQKMIESDPVMSMYFTQMFEEQPSLLPRRTAATSRSKLITRC